MNNKRKQLLYRKGLFAFNAFGMGLIIGATIDLENWNNYVILLFALGFGLNAFSVFFELFSPKQDLVLSESNESKEAASV